MNMRKFAMAGAAAIAFAGLLTATPTMAFTHHPATPDEIQQTDALNAQALSNAQMGSKPNQPSASTTPAAVTPSPDATAPAATPTPDTDATTPDTAMPATGTTATPRPAPPSTDAPTQ